MARAVVALFLALAVVAGGEQHPKMYMFSAGDEQVPHATTIPQLVEDVVAADIRAHNLIASDTPGPTSSWTSGTEVPSQLPKRRLFVLMGLGPIRGANTTQFWIVELNDVDHKARILKRMMALSFTLHYMEGELHPRLTASAVIARSVWRCDVWWSHDRYVEQPDCDSRLTPIR